MDVNAGEELDNPNAVKGEITEDQLAKLEQSIGAEPQWYAGSIATAAAASSARKDSSQRSLQMVLGDMGNSLICSGPLGGECTSNDSN